MRLHPAFAVLLLVFSAAACDPSPTEDDIERAIEQELSSVVGPWQGTSTGSNLLTLDFQLQAGAGTAISGSGTMKEGNAASVPITITGTFSRPQLSLTISGMMFEGRAVQGTFQGSYTTVGGIIDVLHLTATGYTRDIQVLLTEQ